MGGVGGHSPSENLQRPKMSSHNGKQRVVNEDTFQSRPPQRLHMVKTDCVEQAKPFAKLKQRTA